MKKPCVRCKTLKPLKAFGVNQARPDGRNVYCRECNRDRMRESRALKRAGVVRKHPVIAKPSVAERVERAILHGYASWRALRVHTRLTEDEIGIALCELIFDKRTIRPRTINGQRVYVRAA